MTEPILKPCPFCGSEGAKLCVAYDPTMEAVMKPSYMVSCRECGTRGPMRNTQEGALESWNSRKEGGSEMSGTTEKSSAVGNYAKMREACETIGALTGQVLDGLDGDREVGGCEFYRIADNIETIALNALNTPMRNCDVGDAYEQGERFARWRKGEGCDSDPEIVLRWAQMPYKARAVLSACANVQTTRRKTENDICGTEGVLQDKNHYV